MSATCAQAVHVVAPATMRVRHYGYVLPNGLKCVIVHDATATMAAAAMSVRAGKHNDPAALPGLAHFCEHMLFMGTDAFPREDEYDHYVTTHAGYTNAWTADDATTYYFRVSAVALWGALARFVSFFVAPRFAAAAMTRELQAVHSEDAKNHCVDAWRIAEVCQTLFHARHPASRYGNGNLTTLHTPHRHELREALLRYFATYYHAKAACLVVYSAHDPDEVLRHVCTPLSRMRAGDAAPRFHFRLDQRDSNSDSDGDDSGSNDAPRDDHEQGTASVQQQQQQPHTQEASPQPPSPSAQANASLPPLLLLPCLRDGAVWVNVRTVRKLRQLQILWPVRVRAALWRSLPAAYIAHVLGHECRTSVLAQLQQRGWATAMSVGPRRVDDDHELFVVTIALTCHGLAHVDEVVTLVYHGIGVARDGGVDARVYAEMQAEAQLHLAASEVGCAEDYCAQLATNANATDLAHAVVGGRVVLHDDTDAACAYMAQLTPRHSVVLLQWSELPCVGECSDDAASSSTTAHDETAMATTRTDGDDDGDGDAHVATAGDDGEAMTAAALFAALPAFAQMPANTRTRFHRACYARGHIAEVYTARWTAALHAPQHAPLALPAPNPYLTTDLTIFANTRTGHDTTTTATATATATATETATTNAETTAWATAVAGVTVLPSRHGTTVVRADAGHHHTFLCALRWRALSPVAYATPLAWLYTNVMQAIVREAVTETSYYGELAALSNGIGVSPGGLTIDVTGPYAPLHDFFAALLRATVDAATLQSTRAVYDVHAEAYVRRVRSRASAQPYELATDRFHKLAYCVLYTHDDIVAIASAATYEGYVAHVQQYLRAGLLFECVAAGNMPSAASMQTTLVQRIEDVLAAHHIAVATRAQLPRFRDVYAMTTSTAATTCEAARVRDGSNDNNKDSGSGGDEDGGSSDCRRQQHDHHHRRRLSPPPVRVLTSLDVVASAASQADNDNVSVVVALYAGPECARVRALCDCAVKLLSSSFFHALRTREALGYVVAVASRRVEGAAYVTLTAQSARAHVDGRYVLARVLAYLVAVASQLRRLCGAAAVADVARALVQQREKPPESVDEDAARLQSASTHPCGLCHRLHEVAQLRGVCADDVCQFVRQTLLPFACDGHDAEQQQQQNDDDKAVAAPHCTTCTHDGSSDHDAAPQQPPRRRSHDGDDDGNNGSSNGSRPIVFVVDRGRNSRVRSAAAAAAATASTTSDSDDSDSDALFTVGTHTVRLPPQHAATAPAATTADAAATPAACTAAAAEATTTTTTVDAHDDHHDDDDADDAVCADNAAAASGDDADMSHDDGDGDVVPLSLPTFAQPTYVTLRVYDSVASLQRGRAVLRSNSF